MERQGGELEARSEHATQLEASLSASRAEGQDLEQRLQGMQERVNALSEELQTSLQASGLACMCVLQDTGMVLDLNQGVG